MRFIEPVTREELHQIKEFDRDLGVVPLPGRARFEQLAMGGHFFGLFLAHGPAQQIGATQRISPDNLGDQHHLFLVDDHPIGAFEGGLEIRVEIIDRCPPVLAIDEIIHHAGFKRARTEKRQNSNDVFEGVGSKLLEQLLHAARFKLEHGRRVGIAQQLVGGRIRERDRHDVEILHAGIVRANEAHGPVENRQVAQAEKVELHQARGFDIVLVKLRDRASLLARLAIQRAEIGQLAGRDQHAAGMHPDVAGQPFKGTRKIDQCAHFLFPLVARAKRGLFLERAIQCPRFGRVVGNQLRQPIAQHVRHIKHPTGVAHHGLGAKRAERCDLAHGVAAVFQLDVLDDPLAVVLAKVDIEVRHRHPLRIQETLEQQVVADRVEIGDPQGVSHERSRTRPAPGADRHAVGFAPVDEILNDQEVTREPHLDDGAALEREALRVARALALALGRIGKQLRQAPFETGFRELHEVVVKRHPVGCREVGQARLTEIQCEVAALRDGQGIGQR